MKTRTTLGVALLTGLVIASSVAGAQQTRMKQSNNHLANEGGIGTEWALADGASIVAPGYPSQYSERGDSVCMAIGYMINKDGSTSNYSVLKSWNSATGDKEPEKGYWNTFAKASAGALAEWKFKPRPEVSIVRPTYTVATMTFTGKEAAGRTAVTGKCAIADLASFLQQKSADFTELRYGDTADRERYLREQAAPAYSGG